MSRTFLDFVEDIVECMERAQRFVRGMDYEAFERDDKTHFAVVRALKIVGEGAKHVPDEIRQGGPCTRSLAGP